LTNAIKFTDQGSIELRVAFYKTASQPGAHGRLQISVTDSGIGLSSAEQERLFQPFVRGDSHAARKTPGTGLGLALSQKLARRLGGDLQLVRSSLGQGSEFAFHLDIEPASQGTEVAPPFETHPVETHAHQQDVHGISALQGARILLVEDAVDLRVLIQRYLSKHGAMIELCENGFDAVERAMKQSFDLILMDMKMPVMDGYEAARTLRQRGYRHPIVALTAYANTSDRQRCFEAGCDDYISKPIDPQHLIHHLARQLSKRVQSSITDESRN
jgi:CheY-like chemotaxis protein